MNLRAHPMSWRPAPTVVWLSEPHEETAEDAPTVYLLDLEAEIPRILEQSSALIWIALLERLAHPSTSADEGVTATRIAEDLTAGAPLDPQDIQPDIEQFLEALGADGVLIPASREGMRQD
ncbi:hypothetical protein [Kocuria palustris]|uniref:hypothetical protein n=1 Tax=Kocuria palustris TaxID=71999 RepID=UPI0024691A5B|nr:hypothetical protein [Kocuria palustris]MDH5151475.1 hypothetical protein [Kocuria palustris]